MIEKKFIILCSGGPDSIYLAHYLLKNFKNELILVHVNYKKRKDSINCQKIVEKFALKNNLKIYKFNFNINKSYITKNFQRIAREFRYEKAISIAKKHNGIIYTGHTWDDSLETMIIQYKRKIIPNYWGIKKNIYFDKIKIVRPLLNVSKRTIIKKLNFEKIIFSIDSSNFQDIYYRNIIRKKLNLFPQILKIIIYVFFQIKNIWRNIVFYKLNKLKHRIINKNGIKTSLFLKLNYKKKYKILIYFLNSNNINFSKAKINNLIFFIKRDQKKSFNLGNDKILITDFSFIRILKSK